MRILHTSDWHLGKQLCEHPLLQDQRQVLAQLTAILAGGEHDAVVIAGDIFDRAVPNEDAVGLLGGWLNELREVAPSLPIILVAGNHDSGIRLAWAAGLLSRSNVHIRGTAQQVGDPVLVTTAAGEEAEIWPVPFLWPRDLDVEGVTPSQVSALQAAVGLVRSKQTAGKTQVLVAHCFAQGGTTSESERNLVGQATLIPPEFFEGFDYVALGHLHRPQAVRGTQARYSGSLLKYSFSEVNDKKQALSVEVKSGMPPVVSPHPLVPLRDLVEIESTLEEAIENPAFAQYRGDLVGVQLTKAHTAGNPAALLRARFPFLVRLHNPVEVEPTVSVPPRARGAEKDDVVEDFTAFEAHIGYSPPQPEVVSALHQLLAGGAQ